MSDDTYQHRVFPELIHAADDVGWVMHATGALGLAAMIIAASLAFMWAGTWPTLGRLARRRRRDPLARLDRLLPAVPLPAVDPDRLDHDVPPHRPGSNSRLKHRRGPGRASLSPALDI